MSQMTRYIQMCCDDCGTWQETMQTRMPKARKYMHKQYGWVTVRRDGKLLDLCKECKGKK